MAMDQDMVDPARPPSQFAQKCRIVSQVAARMGVVPSRIEKSVKRIRVRHGVEIAKKDAGTRARDRVSKAVPNGHEHWPYGCQVHVGGRDDDCGSKATLAEEAPEEDSRHDVSPADRQRHLWCRR